MENVTVIIPSFNRAAVLPRALASVCQQTSPPGQIIVVDDGSIDKTAQMVAVFGDRVEYHYQPNKGVSSARNAGISRAKGEWIAFLDSDDVWHPQKLEHQWAALSRNPDLQICHTHELWLKLGQRLNPMKKHQKQGGDIFEQCLPLCVISPSSVLIQRRVLENIGLFDEGLPACEDYDLWLRLSARYPVLYLEEALLTKHGGHADQLSKKYGAMDRFRIRALHRLLASGCLTATQQHLATEMLLIKLKIYINGAHKRQRHQAVINYEKLLQHYQFLRQQHEVA